MKCNGITKSGKKCSFTATCGCYCKKHKQQDVMVQKEITYHNHFVFEPCNESCPLFWNRGLVNILCLKES